VRDLRDPAAGEDGDEGALPVEAEPGEEPRAVGRGADEVDEGVPDELDGHPGRSIELFLEGEDHEHARDRLPDGLNAPALPRPYLG
jgi:hypothetical protein